MSKGNSRKGNREIKKPKKDKRKVLGDKPILQKDAIIRCFHLKEMHKSSGNRMKMSLASLNDD